MNEKMKKVFTNIGVVLFALACIWGAYRVVAQSYNKAPEKEWVFEYARRVIMVDKTIISIEVDTLGGCIQQWEDSLRVTFNRTRQVNSFVKAVDIEYYTLYLLKGDTVAFRVEDKEAIMITKKPNHVDPAFVYYQFMLN